MAQVRAEVLKQLGYTTSAVCAQLDAERKQHLYYCLLGDCPQQISSQGLPMLDGNHGLH